MSGSLETSRLRLRRLIAADEAALVALDSDPEVMRHVGVPAGVKSSGETVDRVRRRLRESDLGHHGLLGFWRIDGRADGVFHGLGALLRMPDRQDVEVAYRLVRGAWGRGIATEAAGALVDHALGALGLPRVVAVTYPDNVSSQRVLDKLGFERRGLTEYKGVQTTYHVLTQPAWRAARLCSGRPVRPAP